MRVINAYHCTTTGSKIEKRRSPRRAGGERAWYNRRDKQWAEVSGKMDLFLETIETKIEFFEAYDLKSLERQIETQIDNNKALLLDVRAVQHQATFDPIRNKMLYTAVVHFAKKRQ